MKVSPNQNSLFSYQPKFGGQVDPVLDVPRLTKALAKVKELMGDGRWHTLREVADFAGCTEAAASARVRDLRKSWAGSHTIDKKRVKDTGLYLYRMVI